MLVSPIWGQSLAWSPSLSDTYDLNHTGMMQIGGGVKEGHGRNRKGISLWNGGAIPSTHGWVPRGYGVTHAS